MSAEASSANIPMNHAQTARKEYALMPASLPVQPIFPGCIGIVEQGAAGQEKFVEIGLQWRGHDLAASTPLADSMMPTHLDRISTARLVLSRPTAADLPDLVRMYQDERVMATLGGVRTADDTRQYLDRLLAHWDEHGFGLWIVREPENSRFIGRGGLRQALVEGAPMIEVGYGLMSEFWGRGLATELARESVRIAFDELQIDEVVSFTLPTNFASQRVMQKAGLHYVRDIVYADLPHVLYRLHRPAR